MRTVLPFLLLTSLFACASAPPPAPAFAVHGETRIHLFTLAGEASAPPVVVVNGGPGASHQSVARLASLAAAGVRVIAYDQRGLGESTAPADDARYALADQVSDLEAVREALGVRQLTLVAHSFGGLVAMAYAAAHPDRVRALVLVSTMAPDWDGFQRGNAIFEARAKALGEAGKLTDAPPPVGDDCRQTSSAVLPVLFADPDYPRTHDAPEARETQCSVHVQSATFATLAGYDVRPGLRAFGGPALVLVGESDPFGDGPSRAAAAAIGPGGAPVIVVPASGHFPWIEGADRFRTSIAPFLRRHAGG